MTTPESRLQAMGLELPAPSGPPTLFEPYVRSGSRVYTSGQIPIIDGQLTAVGRLGNGIDIAAGQAAARVCALNVLAQLRAAAGSLDRIARLVKLTVFVASAPDFTSQPEVANAASQLFIDVLGPAGAHARSAIGVAALPLGVPVEIEAIAELAAS